MADASKAANVKLLIWSGLQPLGRLSGGKHPLRHFDGKAEVTEYTKTLGIPVADVEAGTYMQNFTGVMRPTKLEDGSYEMRWPATPDLLLPVFDAVHDYGLFVRKVIEAPTIEPFTSVYAHSQMLTPKELANQLREGADHRAYI